MLIAETNDQIGNRPGHWVLAASHYEKSHEMSDDLKRLALFCKDLCKIVLRHFEKYSNYNIAYQ